MINKHMFRKTNDKKILHKVGKQWKVISVALLLAMGGFAATGITSHASANNGVTPTVEAEANSLEAMPSAANPSVNSAKASSTAPSVSAKAPSKENISYAPSARVAGNNASAASYHNNDNFDKANVKFYGPIVKNYVNSINAKYPQARSLAANYDNLSGSAANDNSKAMSYSATAQNPNVSNEISMHARVAGQTTSYYTGSVAYNVLGPFGYMANVSNDASLTTQESAVASGASLVSAINHDPVLSTEYHDQWELASANANADSAYASNDATLAHDIVANSSANQANLSRNQGELNRLSLGATIAGINSGIDASTVNSIASAAGFKYTSSAVSSAVAVLADHFNGNSIASADYWNENGYNNNGNEVSASANDQIVFSADGNHMTDVIGVNVPASTLSNDMNVNANNRADYSAYASASNALSLYRVVSDTAAQRKYARNANGLMNGIARDRSAITSYAIAASAANSAEVSANNKASASASVASADDYLGNHPSLAGIFGVDKTAQDYADQVVADAQKVENNNLNGALTGNATDGSARKDQLNRVIAAGVSTLTGDTTAAQLRSDLSNVDGWMNDLKTVMANTKRGANNNRANVWYDTGHGNNAKEVAFQRAVVNAFYGYYGDHDAFDNVPLVNGHTMFHGYYMDHVAIAIDNAVASVSVRGKSGLLNPTKYAAASDALTNGLDIQNLNESLAVANVTSAANDEASDYNRERSASASYSTATDQDVTIASQFASYYGSMARNERGLVSNAKNSLGNFYGTHAANPGAYANASSVYQSASVAEPNDKVLAYAYGINVLNHSPHYITLTRNAMLHSDPAFTKGNAVKSVHAGDSFTVDGIGFDPVGNVRYTIQANNGKKYYLTGNDNYVRDTYLEPGQTYNVKFTRRARVHSNLNFGQGKVTGYVKAGKTVTGTAVRADGYYEGMTRLQLSNGDYVTANLNYVKVINTEQQGNNTNESNSGYPLVTF